MMPTEHGDGDSVSSHFRIAVDDGPALVDSLVRGGESGKREGAGVVVTVGGDSCS